MGWGGYGGGLGAGRTPYNFTKLKIVRYMGSSSHLGLIMVPGQEANSDSLGICFISFTIIVY